MSQAIRSVLSRDRDLVLCGEAGLGGLLKVELLEAVEWRGESESCRGEESASITVETRLAGSGQENAHANELEVSTEGVHQLFT